MTLNSNVPLGKVSAATLASALAALIIWLLRRYAGVDSEGAAVIGSFVIVAVTFLAGYFTPLSDKEATAIVNAPSAPEQAKL